MNRDGDIRLVGVFIFLGLVVLGAILVSAAPVYKADTYGGANVYYFLEDISSTFNFSDNLTEDNENMNYWQVLNITSTNHSYTEHSDYKWFAWDDTGFSDSEDGLIVINSTSDNQTGNFSLRIFVFDGSDDTGLSVDYKFMVNATNDRPNFTSLDLEYNITVAQEFYEYINATDEEEQYPLWFNITWFANCTHAAWSDRDNCSLFDPVNVSNTAAEMNFTPINNDAGTYWANVTIMDWGEQSTCPHEFCFNDTYAINKTWERTVEFNILSTLSVNVTNCTGSVPSEGTTFSCSVNISTQGEDDSIDISTTSILTNYADSGISNRSWFYGNDTDVVVSSNSKTINVSFTASKAEIGNWTINFTADDLNDSVAAVTEQIYINVTRTYDNLSKMSSIENSTTSINLETTIYFNATDEDLLIPDKGVFNESIIFSKNISNSTGQEANYLFIITNGTTSGNFSHATITFTPNSTDVGWYQVNITAANVTKILNSTLFNITISDNIFPSWNESNYTINLTVGATAATTTHYGVNLTNGYVNDTAGDVLVFSNTTNFTNFNLTTYGLLNITQYKQDVGTWRINITATDVLGLANTTEWVFNITNTNSEPNITNLTNTGTLATIAEGSVVTLDEDILITLNLSVSDDDLLITQDKESIYNETLSINLTFVNTTSNLAVSELFTFVAEDMYENRTDYYVEYIPDSADVGAYNITVNITDASEISDYFSFNLTISGQNDAPVLAGVYNQTITNVTPNNEFYMDVNATDEEDGSESNGLLNFSIESKTTSGDFLIINETTGVIEFTVNSTSLGIWEFNVSVNDTSGKVDSEKFNVSIYGTPIIDSPSSGFIFNLTENTTFLLGFTANHTIADNLTYEFYIDNIAYSDSSTYSYGDLTLRETNASFGNLTNYSWTFTPNFTDETYGLEKNLTLVVYPNNSQVPDVKNANTTVTFKVNITHKNSPIVYDTNNPIGSHSATVGQNLEINLTDYFIDIDADDKKYNQTINFTVDSNATPSRVINYEYSGGIRILTLTSSSTTSESLTINGSDFNTSVSTEVDSSDVSGNFVVTFTSPSTTTVTTAGGGGGGGGAKVKHYSLKIITPKDVIITPEKNLIQVPFSVENNGQVDLKGINLSSFVRFNNQFSEDITISIADDYINELKFGQSEDFVMVIRANTQRSGRYKATIYANVITPKFSDWGDFFIDLRKTNETEAEQLLIFTEKFISENPECIELTELLKEARVYFNEGDYSESYRLSQQAIEACEEAISANEQVRFDSDTVRDSFYYISFATLVIFFVGFIFYVYKRVRFNKAKVDEYI